ncbi:hypothetical protein MNEG_11420 [Monoraphidium neglectum]|uniref:Thioredoxin domain-containing protein n=1 Tax=Monoraphidium neglectum TaxID=145388 RepID=A0A0D2KLA6_9CHLO|nr:hypothetical protein MNEG_11420 [Monoraphidium neglectum]KIY96543.1 hypothetical protein MNEG_11420 [Monoraphidium neglectum]|eukprot:XP_013895563.1 hypothetical protein MNEG_11420 [Monoraphidium neglectum]
MPADDVLAGLRGAADALRDPDAAAALIRANNADPHCTGFLSRTIRDVAVQLHALQVRTAACEAARAACAAALGPRALEYRRARVCEARACAAVDEMTLCAALRLAAGVAAPLLALRGVFAAVVLAAHSLLMCCGTGAHPVISEAHGFAKMRQQQQALTGDPQQQLVTFFYLEGCPNSIALKPVAECLPAFFPTEVMFVSVEYGDLSLLQLMTNTLHALPVLQVSIKGKRYRYRGRHKLEPLLRFLSRALGRPPLAPTGIAAHCDAHPSACGGWRCERTDGEATVAELTGQPATLLHLSIAFLALRCCVWCWKRRRRQQAATQGVDDGGHPGVQEAVAAPVAPAAAIEPGGG